MMQNTGRSPLMAELRRVFCSVVVVVFFVQLVNAQTMRFAQVPSYLTVADTAPFVLRCAASTASAHGTVRYVWEKDGSPYAATQWIDIASASLDNAGWYVCIAIQGRRAIRSEPALVTVTARSTTAGEARNGTSVGSVTAIAVAVPLSLLGLLLLLVTIIIICLAIVCSRRRKRASGGLPSDSQRLLEGQTTAVTSLLAQSNTMSVQNITEAQVVTGDGDGVDTPGRGEHANEGAKGVGVGAKCTGDGAEGTDGGAKGVRGAGSDGCEGSKDIYPDDLQLDVAMFEQPPPLKTFSAEDIITLNELPPALQRSPRVVNLSHLRSPRTSDGNMIFLTSSSKDAMKRVFHSLISIPTAASASDGNSDGMLSPSDVLQTVSEDMGVSAPMSIPVLVQNEVQMPCVMDDAHKTIVEQTKPPTAVIEPPTAVIEPPTAVIEPPTAVIEPPTAFIEPPTAVIEPPTAVIEPPTAVIEPPTAVIGPPTAVIGPPAINTVFSAKDHEASPREESLPSSPQIAQYEQPQPKVSELRQMFQSGSVESPPYLTTVASQRQQRSKLITQRARHMLGQEQASQEDSAPQVTASSPEVSSATPEKVPSEISSTGEQHSSEVKLVQHTGPPHMPGDGGSAGSDAKHAAGQQEADKARPPLVPIATGSPAGEASDHNEGRKEPPRGGHIIGDPRDLNVLPQRPHVISPVFGTPSSRSPLQHHHRPASNLLVSMSAGSPGGRGSPGHTPPPSRRCEAVHTNVPQSSHSTGIAMSAGYLSNEASLDEAYDRTTSVISSPTTVVISSPTPVISSPTPVISSPTPVISSPTPVTPFHARDVQSDIDGDDTSNRGDEEAWSSNSDDDLVSPLVIAPPPARRVDTINSSRHHRHPQEAVLSASVKDCIAQMSKVVHTQPLFSEPRKIHLGRQGRKLSAIPEDSPTVSS